MKKILELVDEYIDARDSEAVEEPGGVCPVDGEPFEGQGYAGFCSSQCAATELGCPRCGVIGDCVCDCPRCGMDCECPVEDDENEPDDYEDD